jgi:hypothetical protein
VPTDLVRDGSRRLITPARIRNLVSLTTLAALAACSGGSLSGPGDASLVADRDGVARGPSGLEQRLATSVEVAPGGSPYTAQLVVTSTIVNTGSESVPLTARVCLFQDADVETTAKLDRFEPLISCAAVSATRTLAPGQSTEPMEVRFGVRSGPGTYTLRLRHALSPEFRAETTFRIS